MALGSGVGVGRKGRKGQGGGTALQDRPRYGDQDVWVPGGGRRSARRRRGRGRSRVRL